MFLGLRAAGYPDAPTPAEIPRVAEIADFRGRVRSWKFANLPDLTSVLYK